MPESVSVIVFVAVFFAAMILRLGVSRGFSNKITGWLVAAAAFGGFVFYGAAYAQAEANPLLAVIRALLCVCRMFTGSVDTNAITYLEFYNDAFALFVFWLIHLMALYATASATISIIGEEALRKLRVWLAHWGDLYIIYGTTSDAISFGRKLADQQKCSVVYVDPVPDSGASHGIIKNGFVLRSDSNAVQANLSFAKSIGIRPGKRKITLYTLSKDGTQNLRYAKALLSTLDRLQVKAEQTSLVILGCHDIVAANMQALDERYGYGFVTNFQEWELATRILMQKYPPCNTISFDSVGKATEDFHALLIGFGHIGQAALRQLVMNGQFAGSKFRCDVFAPDCQQVSGFLNASCRNLMDLYDIRLHTYDGRSTQMFEFLQQHASTLKYIVVCTGNEKSNREISTDIAQFFQYTDHSVPIYQCAYSGLVYMDSTTLQTEETKLYDPKLMRYAQVDAIAMEINKYYWQHDPRSAMELWMACNYFDRSSNRAAADYIPAILRAAGTTAEEVIEKGWTPNPVLLENLGIAEHLRWCAFHYCMGFSAMTDEEFSQRADIFRDEVRRLGSSKFRISKNIAGRTHACLIPWKALDALSAKENAITGKNVDYKDNDIRNIQIIRHALQASQSVK